MKNIQILDVPLWYENAEGAKYRRESLPGNHPENLYNHVKREYGVDPEDYGIKKPVVSEKCEACNQCLEVLHSG